MPIARFELPDGRIARFEVPEGTTPEQAQFLVQSEIAKSKPDTFLGMDKGKLSAVGQGAKDAAGGFARSGMGIVSNLMRPFEAAIPGGNDFDSGNQQRMAQVDQRFRNEYGVNPDAVAFQGGKLAGDVAATLPVGGALAAGAKRVPMLTKAVPGIENALRTGGMTTGNNLANATRAARALDMGTRVAGGGITGGAMAGIVDPESVGTGAMVGAALPPGLKVAGAVGGAVKRTINGPVVPDSLRKAVESARGAGYVIPPSQAKPTLANRMLEGLSGKITTAQNASARNQPITQALVAKELGLPAGVPVTADVLKQVRTQAGTAYDAVASTGLVKTTPEYFKALDDISEPARRAAAGFPNAKPNPIIDEIESLKTAEFDASSAVSKIKELRSAADTAYASGNKELGKALKSASAALEDAIDKHLTAIGAPADLLNGFRNARQLIAKTYSVEKAMNATSGNVDAVKLGQQLAKGKPLSGGIKQAAAFGQQFPKAAQTIERMGSLPQSSPLDWAASGLATAATQNPAMMAGLLLRPAARNAVLSNTVQNRLANPQTQSVLMGLLADPMAQQMLYRTAPVIASQ